MKTMERDRMAAVTLQELRQHMAAVTRQAPRKHMVCPLERRTHKKAAVRH